MKLTVQLKHHQQRSLPIDSQSTYSLQFLAFKIDYGLIENVLKENRCQKIDNYWHAHIKLMGDGNDLCLLKFAKRKEHSDQSEKKIYFTNAHQIEKFRISDTKFIRMC